MEMFPKADKEIVGEGGNPLLEAEIRRRIHERGRMTFAEFMELALYHPEYGYYSRESEKLGPRGDFSTSPETHPVFGGLIGRQIEQMWIAMGKPEEFAVVEMGAGTGTLCSQVLRYAQQSDFGRHLHYVIVEKSADLSKRQRDNLNEAALGAQTRVSWFVPTEASPLPTDVLGCFLSNELIDAFPVHRVTMSGGRLREIYVGETDGKLVDVVGDLSTPLLAQYFDDLGITTAEGAKAEVNLAALEWMRQVARALDKGFVITVDYGFPAEDLYAANRCEGTLVSYFRHSYGTNPYVRIGKQDMTTHVDFSGLIRVGRTAGLQFVGLLAQSDFLINLGLEGYIAALERRNLPSAMFYDNKFAMRRLIMPDGLGKFKALVQQKGMISVELDCFNPCNDWKRELITGKRELEVPLLAASEE